MTNSAEKKPTRLYFKTYLQAINNSVGSNMFKNFYLETKEQGEFDSMRGGELSCAFFVSGLLKIFDKVARVHGTVASTVKDLENSGWELAEDPNPGDVLVWERAEIEGEMVDHIGFCIGDGKAVSNSYKAKTPIEHDMNFSEYGGRQITAIYRMKDWDSE